MVILTHSGFFRVFRQMATQPFSSLMFFLPIRVPYTAIFLKGFKAFGMRRPPCSDLIALQIFQKLRTPMFLMHTVCVEIVAATAQRHKVVLGIVAECRTEYNVMRVEPEGVVTNDAAVFIPLYDKPFQLRV